MKGKSSTIEQLNTAESEVRMSNLQNQLRELNYVYAVIYGYLTHIQKKLAYYEQEVAQIPSLFVQQSQQVAELEAELSETLVKIDFVNQEMEGLSQLTEHITNVLPLNKAVNNNRVDEAGLQLLKQYLQQLQTQLLASEESQMRIQSRLENLGHTALFREPNHQEESEAAKLEALTELLERTTQDLKTAQQETLSYQEEWRLTQVDANHFQAEAERFENALKTTQTQLRLSEQEHAGLQEALQSKDEIILQLQSQLKNEAQSHQEALFEMQKTLDEQVAEHAEILSTLDQAQSDVEQDYLNLKAQWPMLQYQIFIETLAVLPHLPEKQKPLRQFLLQKLGLSTPVEQQIKDRLLQGDTLMSHLVYEWLEKQTHDPSQDDAMIPAGSYLIGTDAYAGESPQHHVTFDYSFVMDPYPVTNAEYAEFISDGGYDNPDHWSPEGWSFIRELKIKQPEHWRKINHHCGPDFPKYPVVGVSWYEALAYAHWAGKRLPTEAEWEVACRGELSLVWPWGNEWKDGVANTHEAKVLNTTPVDAYPDGISPFGCFDMIGNVFEWTHSLYKSYPYDAQDGREDIRSLQQRTLRGCAWSYKGQYFTRASHRFFNLPGARHSDMGFRCVQRISSP